MSKEQENIKVIKSFFDSFLRGEVLSAVDRCFAPDVEYTSVGTQSQETIDAIPWSGFFRGREEIKQAFIALGDSFEVLEFTPREYVAQDDAVAVFGSFRFRAVPTQRLVESDFAMNFRLYHGQITRYLFFENTYAVVLGFRHSGTWEIENVGRRRRVPA